MTRVVAPLSGTVLAVNSAPGDLVSAEQHVVLLESMKIHVPVEAGSSGRIEEVQVKEGDTVERGMALFSIAADNEAGQAEQEASAASGMQAAGGATRDALAHSQARQALTLDPQRSEAAAERHRRGYRTARENIQDLADDGSFLEYGQLAVAAQSRRIDIEKLRTSTAADGIITGVARVNQKLVGADRCRTALIVNDYSVLAGTQGFFHHQKLDRILAVAEQDKLPVIMYTEGGGGRPGDTDVTTMQTGLHCTSFESWAGLSGIVPRITVANGFNFAGNAALFGAGDITIATSNSWIGMAGPAMIEGGGLGKFKPTEIGPIEIQAANGVVDIVAADEAQATDYARRCLSMFQGNIDDWSSVDQDQLRASIPDNRRYTYDVRGIINTVADEGSFIELRRQFGGAVVTGLARLQGRAVGILASDCAVLGGAIDVTAGEKAADFMQLCNAFGIPLISFCDTPGFMVGPQHEELGAVRRLAKLFTAGSKLDVPMISIILRKCYGLGAQALLGGRTLSASYAVSWPTGEFGAMGLEGAVKLGFKKELAAETDPQKRQALFDQLLNEQYACGKATEIASKLEIDAVIDPADTRATILQHLN